MEVSYTKSIRSLSPNPSHFRQVLVSTIGNKYLDPVHRHMFLPQWKFSEVYEKLFKEKQVPYHTEDIAYTLQHFLDKVTSRSGIQYTQVFTETGRHLHRFSELPDFLSKVIIGTEYDLPPERLQRRPVAEKRSLLVLSAINLPKLILNRKPSKPRTQISTPKLSLNHPVNQSQGSLQALSRSRPKQVKETVKSCDYNGDRDKSGLQTSVLIGNVEISGHSMRPLLTDRGRTKSISPETESSQTLVNLFTPQQIESIQSEYLQLRHLVLVQKVNDTVKTYNKVQRYLTSTRSKVTVNAKFYVTFATFVQSAIPTLKGKPMNVFRAVLRGLGSDERDLSWSQWLLLNALLLYNTAPETTKLDFICRVTVTQMLSTRPDYLDVMLLLTSLFQADSQNAQFQVVYQQLKAIWHESALSMSVLRRKCLIGLLDYEAILSRFRKIDIQKSGSGV